jgi:hypothetical protein
MIFGKEKKNTRFQKSELSVYIQYWKFTVGG